MVCISLCIVDENIWWGSLHNYKFRKIDKIDTTVSTFVYLLLATLHVSTPVQWVSGLFSLRYSGRDLKLLTYVHLVLRLRIRGGIRHEEPKIYIYIYIVTDLLSALLSNGSVNEPQQRDCFYMVRDATVATQRRSKQTHLCDNWSTLNNEKCVRSFLCSRRRGYITRHWWDARESKQRSWHWTNIWPWVPAGPGARFERAGWLPAVSFCCCCCCQTVLKSSAEFSVGNSHGEFVVEEELEVGLWRFHSDLKC
jgi:hypothetical protein